MSNAQIEEIMARHEADGSVYVSSPPRRTVRMMHADRAFLLDYTATLTPKPCTGEPGKPPCSVWKSLSVHGNCRDCGHPKEAHGTKPCTGQGGEAYGEKDWREESLEDRCMMLARVSNASREVCQTLEDASVELRKLKAPLTEARAREVLGSIVLNGADMKVERYLSATNQMVPYTDALSAMMKVSRVSAPIAREDVLETGNYAGAVKMLVDVADTLEAMDLHADNGLYDRVRAFLEAAPPQEKTTCVAKESIPHE